MRSRQLRHDVLLDLIELAYAASDDPRRWEPFLLSLAESLAAKSAHLLHHDLTGSGSVSMSVRTDPEAIRLYNEHFHHVDPFALSPVARAAAPGVCATDEMFISRTDLIRSEYFNDFAVKFDAIRLASTIVDKTNSPASALTILRGRHDPPFDDHDLLLLKSLSPHVRRALQIHQRVHGAEQERAVAVEALNALRCAVFLVDAESTVVLANQKGHKLLAARDGLSTDRGRLCALSSGDTKRLRDLCAGVASTRTVLPRSSGGALALDGRPSGRPPLQVLVTPAASPAPLGLTDPRIAALVFVSDPAEAQRPSERLLRELYGLTPAESDVAARLAIGQSVREIAAARGSAIETVRRQNKQILAKTGARHRSELVHMLSTMLPASVGP